jgi:MFS transporter, ACS family, glucarate transporter
MNADQAARPPTGAPVRYLLVAWIMVISAVSYLDRTNIAIAGVEIGREFHIDNTQLGWIFSAFLVGYSVFQIPGGALARRFGPRRVIAVGALWSGIFTFLTASVPAGLTGALMVLILIRFSLAAGEATIFPSSNQFVERWIPLTERGRANGIIFGGVGLGSGLTPLVVTAILLRFGWRASFWFSSLVVLSAATVWFLFSRDTPEEHPKVSAGELAHIEAGREDTSRVPARGAAKPKGKAPWGKIILSKEIWGVTVSYFTFGYIAWMFFSWFYIYLVQVRHLSLKSSALYSMVPFLAMTAGSMLGGAASDWLTRRISPRVGRCYLAAGALFATAILLDLGSKATEAPIASLVLACGAGALYISQSCYWSVTADYAGEFAGVVSGTMNMGCQAGGAVTASLTPFLAQQFGWGASFLAATILAVVGALAWLIVNPKSRLIHSAGVTDDAPAVTA